MICYYFEEAGVKSVVVPYLFTARINSDNTHVIFDPDCLEQTVYALIRTKEFVEENVKLGRWTRLELNGKSLKDICSLCFDGKTDEAGRIAVELCRGVLNHIRARN